MDTKLIKQYGEDILCYRLRTARQKKRMQYKDFDKHLIQLHKEERALFRQRRDLGWEPLLPPVQKGWKRFFVLREDVARSNQAGFFDNILKKINTYEWSYRKDFKVKRKKSGRKHYVVRDQKLLQSWEGHFGKLGFDDKEKQMFHEEFRYTKQRNEPVKIFVFNEPWRFVLRVRPNMITKARVKDAVLESKIQEIDNYMEKNDHRKRQIKLLQGGNRWRYGKDEQNEKQIDPLKNRSIQNILDQLKNEEI